MKDPILTGSLQILMTSDKFRRGVVVIIIIIVLICWLGEWELLQRLSQGYINIQGRVHIFGILFLTLLPFFTVEDS